MALTRIGQIWEITNSSHRQYGQKFIIIGNPIVTSKLIPGTNAEDHVWVDFRYIDGSPGAGSISWIRHDCSLRGDL